MKGKSATLLVLVVAAVVLGCFAVKSYFDFQVTKLEYLRDTGGNPNAGQAAVDSAGAIPPPPGVGVAVAPAPAAVSTLPAVSSPGGAPAPLLVAPAPVAPPTGLADAEVARLKEELEMLRKEQEALNDRQNQLANGNGDASTGTASATGATPAISADPETMALRKKIMSAPALAQVAVCRWEFDHVWINGGSDRNIVVGSKFAVRRGHEIMGYITVEEVEADMACTKLTSKNALSETARRPEPGDDVINWPPF